TSASLSAVPIGVFSELPAELPIVEIGSALCPDGSRYFLAKHDHFSVAHPSHLVRHDQPLPCHCGVVRGINVVKAAAVVTAFVVASRGREGNHLSLPAHCRDVFCCILVAAVAEKHLHGGIAQKGAPTLIGIHGLQLRQVLQHRPQL